jgi:hypothetical protein
MMSQWPFVFSSILLVRTIFPLPLGIVTATNYTSNHCKGLAVLRD